MDHASITVVISTRNRGDKIVKTIQSILENDFPHFEVVIVDQSENDWTEISLKPFLCNPGVRYIRTKTKGVSVGRDIGIVHSNHEYIAITDDDCETPRNWLREMMNAFSLESKIGIVFGNVHPGPHDCTKGFIPVYLRNQPFLARSIHEKNRVNGLGACMGLRRSVYKKINGFDKMLGNGGAFRSAEETDLTIRCLLANYFVYETPNVMVIHHGFRDREDGVTLICNYSYGTGAMFAKHLKCGHWSVVQFLFQLARRWIYGRSKMPDGCVISSSFESRPLRWLRLSAFIKGIRTGLLSHSDRNIGCYTYKPESCVKTMD